MNNKLNKVIENHLQADACNLSKLEKELLSLIDAEKSNIDYIIQYVLVLLQEPILDYDTAFEYLSNTKDIRAVLLRSYIQDWYYGMPPDVNKNMVNEYIGTNSTNAEISCLYYYASLNTENVSDKATLLKKSLEVYQYNFLSILDIKKLPRETRSLHVDSYFEACVKFMNRLNNTSYFSKQWLYKPFMSAKMLGLDRTHENISSIKQLYAHRERMGIFI